MVPAKLDQVKNVLYEILTDDGTDTDEGAVKATQNMGVSVTNSMKKSGINIIQMQSVVNKKVVNKVVKALSLIDDIKNHSPAKADIQIETIFAVIEWLADQNLTLNEFLTGMKRAYVEAIVNRHDTRTEAAKVLGIQRTYLSRLMTSLNIRDEESGPVGIEYKK